MLGDVIRPVQLALSSPCADVTDVRRFLEPLTGLLPVRFTYRLTIHFSAGTAPQDTALLPAQISSFATGCIVVPLMSFDS